MVTAALRARLALAVRVALRAKASEMQVLPETPEHSALQPLLAGTAEMVGLVRLEA